MEPAAWPRGRTVPCLEPDQGGAVRIIFVMAVEEVDFDRDQPGDVPEDVLARTTFRRNADFLRVLVSIRC